MLNSDYQSLRGQGQPAASTTRTVPYNGKRTRKLRQRITPNASVAHCHTTRSSHPYIVFYDICSATTTPPANTMYDKPTLNEDTKTTILPTMSTKPNPHLTYRGTVNKLNPPQIPTRNTIYMATNTGNQATAKEQATVGPLVQFWL